MIIEKIPLRLSTLNLDQVKYTTEIIGLQNKKNLKLNPHQMQTLQLIAQSKSIFEIIRHFLDHKVVPSFLDIRELLQFLVDENLLLNPELKAYFNFAVSEPKTFIDDLIDKMTGQDSVINLNEELDTIPFFRSLEPALKDVFVRNAKVIEAPSDVAVCTQGQTQRGLFVLLKGEAKIIKTDSRGRRQQVATLKSGSVFGETGFFTGEPRTADVVTTGKCLIARFKYLPELFDDKLKTQTAKGLQKRFWMIHALLKSEVFRELPQDCFDALLFSGKAVNFNPDQKFCVEGEPGNTCYLVVQGQLVVSRQGKSVRILDQGDCFGEMALILNRGKRTASVTAKTAGIAMEIDSDNFYDLLSENLWLGCEFERVALERWQKDAS